jgi:hypothetical protein
MKTAIHTLNAAHTMEAASRSIVLVAHHGGHLPLHCHGRDWKQTEKELSWGIMPK